MDNLNFNRLLSSDSQSSWSIRLVTLTVGSRVYANSRVTCICYYEITNYVLLLYNRVVLGCAIILLANSRISQNIRNSFNYVAMHC